MDIYNIKKQLEKSIKKIGALALLCVALSALVLSGCSCANSDANKADIKKDVKVSEKVIALTKSIGELWLLSGGSLVGVTEDAIELEGLPKDVVNIGTISSPNEETIVGLKPDLVLLSADYPAHKTIKDNLDSLGIQTKSIDINNFDDYSQIMKELTDITGRSDLFKKNVEDVKDSIDSILKEYQKSDNKKDATYLCMRVSASKNKALKSDYFACDILNDFGLKNVADNNNNLTDLSLEAILSANPDYIFVIYQGKENEASKVYSDVFTSQDVWKELNAVKNNRTYLLPKDLFQYKPNEKWADAYKYIYEIIK